MYFTIDDNDALNFIMIFLKMSLLTAPLFIASISNSIKIIFSIGIFTISIGLMCIFPSHCRSTSFYFIFTTFDSSRLFKSIFHCFTPWYYLPGKKLTSKLVTIVGDKGCRFNVGDRCLSQRLDFVTNLAWQVNLMYVFSVFQ